MAIGTPSASAPDHGTAVSDAEFERAAQFALNTRDPFFCGRDALQRAEVLVFDLPM